MSRCRILHLYANYKWTGPADPAIRCAAWLRRIGRDVRFARAGWTLPGAEHRMDRELWRWRLPVVTGLELRKHFRLRSVLRDSRRLRALIRRDGIDVLHAHQPGDHLIAALARRGLQRPPVLVRSLYEPDPPARGWRPWLAGRETAAVVAPTAAVGAAVGARWRLPAERVLVQDPPVEPGARRPAGDLRGTWAVPRDGFLVGITARIQPHRRFDLLWQVARRVVDEDPGVRFVLLGRGNDEDTRRLVAEPVARLGLDRHVLRPGYLYEPDYSRALRSLDVFLFLVPGSDGTCRAVREAMALEIPVVATDRGILPELMGTGDGAVGLCCREDAGALARALLELRRDGERRRTLGRRAGERTRTAMDPTAAAHRLGALYDGLLGASR